MKEMFNKPKMNKIIVILFCSYSLKQLTIVVCRIKSVCAVLQSFPAQFPHV